METLTNQLLVKAIYGCEDLYDRYNALDPRYDDIDASLLLDLMLELINEATIRLNK